MRSAYPRRFRLKMLIWKQEYPVVVFLKLFLVKHFWLRKLTTDSHILAHVNTEYPGDRYPKLNIYVSEIILDSYEY